MKKILNIVLLLSLLVGVSSCNKEKGNESGEFKGTERNAIVKSMVAKFADYSTKSTDNNVVSKSTTKINDEYSLDIEIVDLTNAVETKAMTKETADFGTFNVYQAKAYTLYSQAYNAAGTGNKIKVQNLDFGDEVNTKDATLDIPVEDKNCRLLIFADVDDNVRYPQLTTNEQGFNTLSVTSGSDIDTDVNLCYCVAESSDFPEAPEKATLSLTPLFSQIYSFGVDSQVYDNEGKATTETVSLETAAILTNGARNSVDITIDASNIPTSDPTPTTSNGSSDGFQVSLEKTPINFIPSGSVMKVKLTLKIGTVTKADKIVSLENPAVPGHRYGITLKVKKSAATEYDIELLAAHFTHELSGICDAIELYGADGVIGRTIPESVNIVATETSTEGTGLNWAETIYRDEDLGGFVISIISNSEATDMSFSNPLYLHSVVDLSNNREYMKLGNTVNMYRKTFPVGYDIMFRETEEGGRYDICIKYDGSKKGKKYLIKFLI